MPSTTYEYNRVDVFRRNVPPEINADGIFYNGWPGWIAVLDVFYEARSARAFPRFTGGCW